MESVHFFSHSHRSKDRIEEDDEEDDREIDSHEEEDENDVSAAWFPSTSLKSKHQPSQYEDLPHQSTDADIFVTDNKIVPSHPASYYVAAVGGGEEGKWDFQCFLILAYFNF
ncbi:SEC12-like protein 2 [Cucumis melo var. makuwa]|uniref:SEC12-like protein 2 n=1 Tax=Cucumis melo var. makuwa TaxID=1194695 RepID=A0A5A7UI88_CUCMM|nr:SEC12-like protein 2 [Cucumis melo var. makuwa]